MKKMCIFRCLINFYKNGIFNRCRSIGHIRTDTLGYERKKRRKVSDSVFNGYTRIKDIEENFTAITNSMGSGSFSHMVEVKWKAYSENPITADLSGEEAVYVHSKVVHEYERLEKKKKSDGTMEQRWVKKQDTVSDNKIWANGFGVKDETGFIAIAPAKLKFHDEQLFSKFEKGEPQPNGLHISSKGFKIGFGGGN